jgi:hypothetical protein
MILLAMSALVRLFSGIMLKAFTVLVMLTFAACAQGATGQMPTPYAPASPEDNGDRHGGTGM